MRIRYFDRNDQDEGPENEGEDPEDIGRRGRQRVLAVETLPQGVERARSYVAVNDPEAGQAEQEEASSSAGVAG